MKLRFWLRAKYPFLDFFNKNIAAVGEIAGCEIEGCWSCSKITKSLQDKWKLDPRLSNHVEPSFDKISSEIMIKTLKGSISQQVTDEVYGKGTYAEVNKDNPDPQVQQVIKESLTKESDAANWS